MENFCNIKVELTAVKGKKKKIMSPYGEINFYRHVYQSSWGGTTYVPADKGARIVSKATPRLAKIIGYQYAQSSSKEVIESMKLSHNLGLNAYIQDLSSSLSAICTEKQGKWTYAIPEHIVSQTTSIALSRDGTTTRIKSEGYRETMCGSLSCYNLQGDTIATKNVNKYGNDEWVCASSVISFPIP